MGYIRVGLGKNGQGVVSPINPIVKTSRSRIGYDHATASSPTTNCELFWDENVYFSIVVSFKQVIFIMYWLFFSSSRFFKFESKKDSTSSYKCRF